VSRSAPPSGEAATWKGLVIIGGAILLGLAVTRSFGNPAASPIGSPSGTDASRPKSSTSTTIPITTSSSVPIRDPKDVKVLVANATATSGGGKKVVDAIKPACYAVAVPVEATAKVKAENRKSTTVYSTPGYEREAAKITIQLALQTTANAALPPEPPVPTKGVPTYNVLVLVGQDLVTTPPQPLAPCEAGTNSSTSSTKRGATTLTTKAKSGTTAKGTTTTKPRTTTSSIRTTTT